jgi:uncharacterized protein YjeT (DUF2065 family)
MAVVPHTWRRLTEGLWDDPKTRLTRLATVVGITLGVVQLVQMPFD